jgi:hypothetical protein
VRCSRCGTIGQPGLGGDELRRGGHDGGREAGDDGSDGGGLHDGLRLECRGGGAEHGGVGGLEAHLDGEGPPGVDLADERGDGDVVAGEVDDGGGFGAALGAGEGGAPEDDVANVGDYEAAFGRFSNWGLDAGVSYLGQHVARVSPPTILEVTV